jgi:predicted RNA-binding Zn-ribbon protein involved in translation (DUF1610 family)
VSDSNEYIRASCEYLRWNGLNASGTAPSSPAVRLTVVFQQRFGDEAACAQYLAAARWPDGFVCPACGGGKAWRLETKAWTYECASCGRQTSVTAGTIMRTTSSCC